MNALAPPSNDAPAAEWGLFAESIPGWRWPPPCRLPGFFRGAPDEDWQRVRDVAAYGWPDGQRVPDPEHWAWEGWLVRMLGLSMPDWWVSTTMTSDGTCIVRVSRWDRARVEGKGLTLGRACIAAAAAIGRWPGGE